MSPTVQTAAPGEPIPLGRVETELKRQLAAASHPDAGPVQSARMSNLVIYCDREDEGRAAAEAVPEVVAIHPARVLLLIGEPGEPTTPVTATVNIWCQVGAGQRRVCCEQVTLRARGDAVAQLPFAVRGLLEGDLPINVWWEAQIPPPMGGPLLHDLIERAQQVIYDSLGWTEPAKGVAATAAWLPRFERDPTQGQWTVASDLNWRRLKFWRRVLGQALGPASAPGALESITEVLVEHGPHAVVQALELVSWLAARLRWRVQKGTIQPNVEIFWQVAAPHGNLRVRIERLPEGPSEVRHVRIACQIDGKPTALNVTVEDERRLAVTLEGIDAAPRTVTVQPQSLPELVGRQLNDRERDAVFRESMAVAQVFAQTLLR